MDADSLTEWFETIWRSSEGYVHIAAKDSELTWRQFWAKWPVEKKAIVNTCLKLSAQENEVHYSPCLWDERSLDKSHFKESWVLWADFDGNAPETWPTHANTPASDSVQPTATSEAPATVPEPSLRLRSSTRGNQHDYWLLKEPITNADLLENLNRTIAVDINSDPGIWNVGRVLRPPNTINFGFGKSNRTKSYPVRVEETSDRVYEATQFKFTKNFASLVREHLGPIPPIAEVLAKGKWNDDFYDLFTAASIESGDGRGRSHALVRLAYYGAEAGFTEEQIYAVLNDADRRWGKYLNRTDREQQLASIITIAKTKYPVSLEELTFAGLTQPAAPGMELKDTYTFSEFRSTRIEIQWLLEGLLSEAGYGIIGGEPGLGKSQLLLRMTESIATGQDFLLWRNPAGPQKSLFFSLEMPFFEIQEFFDSMGDTYMQKHQDNLVIAPVGDMIPLDREEGQKYLERLMDEVQPKFLAIDSLTQSLSGKVTDDDIINPYNRYLTKLKQKYNCAIVSVHHNRKSQDRRFVANQLDDLYGSRYIPRDAQFVFMLYRNPKLLEAIWMNVAKLRFRADISPFELIKSAQLEFTTGDVSLNDNDRASGFSSFFRSVEEGNTGGEDNSPGHGNGLQEGRT